MIRQKRTIDSVDPPVRDTTDDRRGSSSRHAPTQWIYRNLTPYRIHARFDAAGTLVTPCREGSRRENGQTCDDHDGKVLSISALGEAVIPHEDAQGFDTLTMRRLGQLELRPAPSCFFTNLPRAIVIYGWLALALVATLWVLLLGGSSAVPWRGFVAVAVLIPAIALTVGTVREVHLYFRFRRYRDDSSRRMTSLEGVERGGRIQSFVEGVPRELAEKLVCAGALAVSIVGLGVAIHLTTQLNNLMPIDYWALVRLDNPFAGVGEPARTSPAFWQLLVGHVAQWVLVSVASIVPAAMYFQFDRQRLSAVQRQWIRDVFRLDPTVRTVRDIEAKYGSQIEASFGNIDPDSGLRLSRGCRSPIIVATVLTVVGWFMLISTTEIPPLTLNTLPDGTSEWVWPEDQAFPVSAFFAPDLTLIGFAFLGAYVFTLSYAIRGYQRRDLQPKTYNTIVVRILTAYALAHVVSIVYDGAHAGVVMFFVGFTPQSALVWLREKVSSRGFTLIPIHEPAPLTELEGIDLYDRARLAEEGVSNVEALAHADIIDLMSTTRIPAAELVDWTDQALLYLKIGGDAEARFDASDRHGPATQPIRTGTDTTVDGEVDGDDGGHHVGATSHVPAVRLNLCHLRCFGIRTATDLVQAFRAAESRGQHDPAVTRIEADALRDALALPSGPGEAKVTRIQTIIDTLEDEEWFSQVLNWRTSEFRAADAWFRYLDGRDWTLQLMRSPNRADESVAVLDVGAQRTSGSTTSAAFMNGNGPRAPRGPRTAAIGAW